MNSISKIVYMAGIIDGLAMVPEEDRGEWWDKLVGNILSKMEDRDD